MKWFLMVYTFLVPPGVTDCMPGVCTRSVHEARIAMPSQAACEQIRDMNKDAHCWATAE